MRELKEFGADVHATDSGGWNAVLYVAEVGFLEGLRELKAWGVDFDLDHLLVVAASHGDDAQVAWLLEQGANRDATHDLGRPNGAGRSAVYWACDGGHLSTLRLLVAKGADFRAADNKGV